MTGSMVNAYTTPLNNYSRNIIECPSTWKGTFNSGYLIPIFWCPTLPGDTIKLDTTFFCRLSTQVLPPMDNIYLDFHFWYVPDRLRWDNFQKFMGERINPNDSIDYLEPTVNSGADGFAYETPFDYIGCPPGVKNYDVNSGIFRAMNLIWNEWYRDENLQDSLEVPLGDGPDDKSLFPLLHRGKRGDYFTTCLPQPQKGPGVELPLGLSAPVLFANDSRNLTVDGHIASETVGGVTYNYGFSRPIAYEDTGKGKTPPQPVPVGISTGGSLMNYSGNLTGQSSSGFNFAARADLTKATAATINSLRQAISLQQFLERDQRSGTRYIELILSHFGVLSPDARLQRPEFLGGTTTMINVNVVPQTSASVEASPQGNLTAYSTSSGTQIGFTHSFVEHGMIIGFACARTDLTYQQGIDRLLTKRTRYDYYWNTFAHLGEQSVLNKEIYVQDKTILDPTDHETPVNELPFGYQERYAEYRYKNSLITGKFRSSYPQSLQNYHYSQYFGELPKLNSDFIEVPTGDDSPIKRTLAVTTEPEFMMDCFHDLVKITEVSIDGEPGLTRL